MLNCCDRQLSARKQCWRECPDAEDDDFAGRLRRFDEIEQLMQDEHFASDPLEPDSAGLSKPMGPIDGERLDFDRERFSRLGQKLSTLMDRGNENAARTIYGQMQALQKESPESIPAALLGEYARRIDVLSKRILRLKDEIALLSQQAVAASCDGAEEDLARWMRRLAAIHAAHPFLLDEAGLESVRRDVVAAAEDRREHQITTKKLLDRERAITSAVKSLATAVSAFHKVATGIANTSDEFAKAEARYLQAIKSVRTYNDEWFAGIVLEFAGLLAEWNVPPPGAENQIDRFLDRISAGLDSIRAEVCEIREKQNSSKDIGGEHETE